MPCIVLLRRLLDQHAIFIEDQNVPIVRANNPEIPPSPQIRKEESSQGLDAFVLRGVKADEGDGRSVKCIIFPLEHHYTMKGRGGIADVRLLREESDSNLCSRTLFTPDVNGAFDTLRGYDAADNGKTQASTSLQRVLLRERME